MGGKTDSSLYDRALYLRRKSLYQRYHYRPLSGLATDLNEDENDAKGEANEMVELLQGCGPPPYDRFDRELAQHAVEKSKKKEPPSNSV